MEQPYRRPGIQAAPAPAPRGPGTGGGYRHGGWTFETERGPEGGKFKLGERVEAEARLLGRVTYEGFVAARPSMEGEAGFAEKVDSMP